MSSVNQPGWSPNNFLHTPRRFFQRQDGVIFALPATEDYHIDRLLKEGYREVASAQGDTPPPPPAPDTRDAEIAALRAELESMKASAENFKAPEMPKEIEHAIAPDDAAAHPRSAGFNRRSR